MVPVRLKGILTHGILAVWSLVCILPLLWVLLTSFKSEAAVMEGPTYLPFVDYTPTLRAWRFILVDRYESLLPRLANSAAVALSSTLLCLLLGAMAAYGFSRFSMPERIRTGLVSGILVTRLLPPVAVVIPLYFAAQPWGLLDTWGLLIAVYAAANLPVAIWLLRPAFGARITDQEQAALLDGASRLRIFLEIAVPMAAGGIAATGLVVFILCWNEYLFAAMLAADHAMTAPPWVMGQLSMKEAQVAGDGEEWANLSAAMAVLIVPPIAIAGFVQRYLAKSMTGK